jgi:hypothetical protein
VGAVASSCPRPWAPLTAQILCAPSRHRLLNFAAYACQPIVHCPQPQGLAAGCQCHLAATATTTVCMGPAAIDYGLPRTRRPCSGQIMAARGWWELLPWPVQSSGVGSSCSLPRGQGTPSRCCPAQRRLSSCVQYVLATMQARCGAWRNENRRGQLQLGMSVLLTLGYVQSSGSSCVGQDWLQVPALDNGEHGEKSGRCLSRGKRWAL